MTKRQTPRRFAPSELMKVGVTIIDRDQRLLSCDSCGGGWQALIGAGGGFFRRYWLIEGGQQRIGIVSGSQHRRFKMGG